MSQKRIQYILPLIIAVALITGIYLSRLCQPGSETEPAFFSISPRYDKLGDVKRFITSEYVDSVDTEKITEDAINGMLHNLDPHSSYIPAASFDAVNDPLAGNFEGIGIQFRVEHDTIMVIQSIAGGPSEKVGVRAGDRIVIVEGDTLAGKGLTSDDVIKQLKGPRGSSVEAQIFRKGNPELIPFTITRDIIPTYSIDAAYMRSDSTGYIKLSRFSATTSDEFEEHLQKLNKAGCKKLIVDLRGNTGGYLQAAIDVSDHFLPEGKTIVYTEGNKRPRRYYYATNQGLFENKPIAVLIDEGSASASEILAGALQDNDVGIIIGRRSFGKGLVQEQLNLPDGSALRLTVARYYTPTGRSIQKSYEGVDYDKELLERYLNGEMVTADSIHFPDSLKFTTPKGKTVYGGGGIMPDIFVGLESGEKFITFNQLIDKGLIYRFAFEYTDRHRDSLERFESESEFFNGFDLSDAIYSDFLEFCRNNKITRSKAELKPTEERIKTLLKAYIARNIFDDAGFYPLYHKIDPGAKKAFREMGDSSLAAYYLQKL